MLHKIELLVAGRSPKIVAFDRVFFAAGAAVFADDSGAALFAKSQVGGQVNSAIMFMTKLSN